MSILISQNFYIDQGAGNAAQPLSHPRIGWDSLITASNITGPVGEVSFEIGGLAIDQTNEMYKPSTSNAVLNVDLGIAKEVDYFGLVGRNMGIVKLEYSLDDITYVEVYEKDDGTDAISMGLFTKVDARYWRFTLTGAGQEIVRLSLGESLAMNRAIGGSHTPINFGRVTAKRMQQTEGGQFVGVTIARQGFASSYNFEHMSPDFQENHFNPFAIHAITGMFFIARDPENNPKEVGFCYSADDIVPNYTGTAQFMAATVNLMGYDPRTGI